MYKNLIIPRALLTNPKAVTNAINILQACIYKPVK